MGGAGNAEGSRLCEALMAACTSCSAMSMSNARLNCRTTTEMPAELLEVICERPCISPNCRSSGAVTVVAMTSGLAPG